jgi:hypothetical protein
VSKSTAPKPPATKEQKEEETLSRLLLPPSTVNQLAEWRAKAIARRAVATHAKPKKR